MGQFLWKSGDCYVFGRQCSEVARTALKGPGRAGWADPPFGNVTLDELGRCDENVFVAE